MMLQRLPFAGLVAAALSALLLALPARAADTEATILLVAKRNLQDALYRSTVLVVRPMGNDQHVGVIINRPTRVTLGQLFPDHKPSREVRDPRVGNVTLTAVTVAPDLSSARVYFVPFGDKHKAEEVGEGLNRAAGFLRGEVGRALALRHAPKLEFIFDQQIEDADRLTRLIDRAVKSDRHNDD